VNVVVIHNEYESRFPSGETDAVLKQIDLLRSLDVSCRYLSKKSDNFVKASKIHKFIVSLRSVVFGFATLSAAESRDLEAADVALIHNTFPYFGFRIIKKLNRHQIKTVLTIHNARISCLSGAHFRESRPCFKCSNSTHYIFGVFFACFRNNRLQSFLFARYMMKLKKSFHLVDRFIVINQYSKQALLLLGIDDSKILLMPNPVSGPVSIKKNMNQILLFAGRLSTEKGLELLLKAYEKSQISQLGWQLHVAGAGPLAEMVVECASRNQTIVFHGQVTHDRLDKFLEESSLVLIPSISYEGFPNMISKAAAHGRPVLISDVGPLSELKMLSWVKAADPNVLAWSNLLQEVVRSQFTNLPNQEARDWWEKTSSTNAVKQKFIEGVIVDFSVK
jgi:glycosyltransferase involved in cell wall biosynthesis